MLALSNYLSMGEAYLLGYANQSRGVSNYQ